MSNEQTSDRVASIASKVLRDPDATSEAKTLAASALTQAPNKKPSSSGRPKEEDSQEVNMTKKKAEEANQETETEAKGDDQSTTEASKTASDDDQGGDNTPPPSDQPDEGTGEQTGELFNDPGEEAPPAEEDPEDVSAFDDEGQAMNKLEQNDLHPAQDGSLRTSEGKTAWAPPGSSAAASAGVQQDASGSFTSTNCPDPVRP